MQAKLQHLETDRHKTNSKDIFSILSDGFQTNISSISPGKTAEEVIIANIKKTIGCKLTTNQDAYSAGLSTANALIHILDDVTYELDNSATQMVETVCLDCLVRRSTQPNPLLHKMAKPGISQSSLKLTSDFLTNNRQQTVSNDGYLSQPRTDSVGTP